MTDSEINEKVAVKLGWHPFTVQPMDLSGPPKLCWVGPKGGDHFESVPDFCNRIEAAWEVVEYLMKTKRVRILMSPNQAMDYCVVIEEIGKEGNPFQWLADTAPMAICLAFLKLE